MQINHREILYVLVRQIIHKAKKTKQDRKFINNHFSEMSLIKRMYTTMICLFLSIKKRERDYLLFFELVIVIDEAIHRQVLDRLYARFDLLIDKKAQ
jgi:hypothetical protein